MKYFFSLVTSAVLIVGVSGCATTRVKRVPDPIAVVVPDRRAVDPALLELIRQAIKTDRWDKEKSLGLWLEVTRVTAKEALRGEEKDEPERAIYNYACARVANDLQEIGWDELPPTITSPEGPVAVRYGSKEINPATFTKMQPAADFRVIGMAARHIKPGLGGALVASRYAAEKEPFVPRNGFFIPLTVLVKWTGAKSADIVFYDPLRDDTAQIDGRKVPLAADFTAPMAAQLSQQRSQGIDLVGFLRPQVLFPDFGLFMLQPYDPTKIPVVFTHGLMSRPAAFRETVNTLQSDPAIRSRYQFWFFRYPSGLPTMVTAARLRRDLGRALDHYDPKRKNPAFENTVLVGHSMGSIISNMQVRDRTSLRHKIFTDPTRLVTLGTELDEVVVQLFQKPPAEQVSLLIFICGPHRGSNLAVSPLAQLFSTLVAVPRDLLALAPGRTIVGLTEFGASLNQGSPQSIYSLSPRNRRLGMSLELPMKPGTHFASIIGDRGRGDTPNSSDGVVPYWSSHLKDAVSETIVPYNHDAQDRELTIAEVRRLLLAHEAKVPLVKRP